MKWNRCALAGVLLTVAIGVGLPGLRAQQGRNFDRLSDEDRAVFAARFTKEIWPLLKRGNEKESCVTCHLTTGGTLRFSGDPAKDFPKLLREGYLQKGDAGSLLERVADRDVKRRMPPKLPAWNEADIKVFRAFINDLHARQQ
jgi:hypothetical protein